MFQLITEILQLFRNCFNREKTWKWFVVLIIGFMTRNEHRGITSILAFMRLKPELYHSILHFFRSSSYKVHKIYTQWIKVAVKYGNVEKIAGRVIFLGDHSKVPKEARYMPDLQTLHQDSQNSGKAEYIEGHNYGQVSVVITNGNISRSLPLVTQLQKSQTKQMLDLACDTAKNIDDPVIIALDAYFSSEVAWSIIDKNKTSEGKRKVEIVTRAQSNSVAFKQPEPQKKKRGQPRKYGEKVKLIDLFSDVSNFQEITMNLYGKTTKVKYLCNDLLWKPIKELVRFVSVVTNRVKCTLMTSDLTLSPEDIIKIYALRFKIETSFSEQKHDMGCFAYHFWTTALPKKKKWKSVESPADEKSKKRIDNTKNAINAYVCLSTIATGILSLIAFSHNCEIWNRYTGWFRTLRSYIPTVATVKVAVSRDFFEFFKYFPFISNLIRKSDFYYQNAA